MSLTKIGSIGINTGIAFAGVTTIATLNGSDSVLSVGGTVNFVSDVSIGGTVSIAGTLTYEDVTNVDAVGLITARDGIIVGSGITLSVDGDGFFTGVVTATSFSGDGSNLSNITSTTINTNAASRVITGSDTANTLNGQSGLTYTSNSGDTILQISGAGQAHLNLITTSGTNHCSVNFGDSDDNDVGEILYTHSTNKLQFVTNATEKMVIERDGNVVMNDNLKVAGVCTATSFSGDGSALTGLSVSTESLTKTDGQTATLDLSKNDHQVTATGTVTIDTSGGTVAESHTIRIVNNGTATILFSSKFLFPSGGTPALPTTSGAISLISFTVHQTSGTVKLLAGSSVNFS